MSYKDDVPFSCDYCKNDYVRKQRFIKSKLCCRPNEKDFCSALCASKSRSLSLEIAKCSFCQNDFSMRRSEIKKKKKKSKSGKIFCCRVCASKSNTFRSQETKNKISKALLAKEAKKAKRLKINTCRVCHKEFPSFNLRKICSEDCRTIFRIDIGRKGGSRTSTLPFHKRARGLNEKAFLEKLKLHFTDILTNKRMFDGWDADIIIPELKLAIHWNGIFHYKPVFGQELFDNVVKKDSLRYAAIEKEGYSNYIIEDLGSQDSRKVEEEYCKFLGFLLTGY